MECKYCKAKCHRAGRQKNGTQKYYCTGCKRCQQAQYKYHAYNLLTTEMIPKLLCESVSIRGMARVLGMVVNALLLSGVEKIKTDKLSIYQSLIPGHRHISNAYNINYIERNNLNLRTHLKRLS
jgi:IS1 family transposase